MWIKPPFFSFHFYQPSFEGPLFSVSSFLWGFELASVKFIGFVFGHLQQGFTCASLLQKQFTKIRSAQDACALLT